MSFTKISVLIPTRGRLHRLETLLASYRATSCEADCELVFRVDQDDVETQRALEYCEGTTVIGPRFGGYCSMPIFFNDAAQQASGDVLMLGNDDMIFKTVKWAPQLLAAANRFPDGLFDLGVHTLNEDHYPFATVSKKVVDRLGFICDPEVFWADIYLRDIMLHFGRCVMVPDVEIIHDWAGFAPDKTFLDHHRDPVGDNPSYWSEVHAPAVSRAVRSLEVLHDQHLCTRA